MTGESINADGYAVFCRSDTDKNLLHYSEKVTVYNMNLNNTKSPEGIEARQKYQYKYDDELATLTKYFTDGRLFYQLNFVGADGESSAKAVGDSNKICGEHLCIQDNYVSDYAFGSGSGGQAAFTLTYSVNGPKKCYDIRTEYEKVEAKQAECLGIKIVNGEIL